MELLRRAEAADKADIPDGMDIPEELSRRTERLKAIKEAKAEIERRASERHAAEQKEYERKCAERADKERRTRKKTGGKGPKPPQQTGPTERDQVNLTDGESRIMPVSGGGFEQAYNAQAGVDTESLLVVAAHITQSTNDKQELKPILDALGEMPEELGSVSALIADNGYCSEANVELCEGEQIPPYIAMGRQKHNPPLWERLQAPPPLSEGADALKRMEHRLKTKEGRALYARRKSTSEPVFGIIKAVMGFRRFMLRGMALVSGEWNLVCMAWNIKRLHVLAA